MSTTSLSLEEIVARIQRGDDFMPVLWERTEKFIRARARAYHAQAPEPWRFEVDDLIQSGYFALFYAAMHYDPERGAGFLGLVDLQLRTAFAAVAGYRKGRALNDAMHRSVEGDALVSPDADVTRLDLIPAQDDGISAAEDRLYLQQLHDTLEHALAQLPDRDEFVIRGRYFDGMTNAELGAQLQCTAQNIQRLERRALRALYAARRLSGLEQFVDERTPFYTPCGAESFQRTHESSVERLVLRREELRQRLLKNVFKDRQQNQPGKNDAGNVPG